MKLIRGTAFPFITSPTYVDKNAIEQTATELGIRLIERSLGALPRGLKPPKKPRTVKRKAVALEEDTDFLSEHESARQASKKRQHPEPLPQTPKRHNNLSARDGLLTPPATSSQQSIPTSSRLPPVAYRAFSSESQGSYSPEEGFRAGAFVDSEVPLPPEPQSQEYIEEAKRIVRAIHRALKLGPDAAICVLSLDLADAEGRVQSASALKLRQLVNHFYIPFNEFLVYGKIPPSAILSVLPISKLLAAIPSIPSDPDIFKILILRDSKSLRSGRIAHEKARLPLSYGVGYAVGKFAQCLGIPHVQPIWEYVVTNWVVDFRFGEGLTRWNEWEDLNDIFRNAVEQGYRSSEGNTLTHPEVPEETRAARRIREDQALAGGYPEHRDAGEIPEDDTSSADEVPIREWMPDIWKYINMQSLESGASREVVPKEECIDDVNALRDLKILDNSDRGPPNQLAPGERSTRQDGIVREGFGIDPVRNPSPLNELRVHNGINGRYAVRPVRVVTLHIRPPRQLLRNKNSSTRDLGRLDYHEGVQVLQRVPPSDHQGNDQTKRREMYEFSWTGM
ncbi:hypothetical protein JMJ35_000809 [Cladonia borealis]|uniref:Uncharacterized protein n=1 Tax=Cladonia borealis TaxID=184061 RepID=A0AA39UE50_9LECA|nr:hypothetical protein JMJ35_000809 [Cladonia borealis]